MQSIKCGNSLISYISHWHSSALVKFDTGVIYKCKDVYNIVHPGKILQSIKGENSMLS